MQGRFPGSRLKRYEKRTDLLDYSPHRPVGLIQSGPENFRVPNTPHCTGNMAVEIRVSNHRKVEPIFALLDLLNHVYKHTYNPGQSQGKSAEEGRQESRVCTALQGSLPAVVPRNVPHAQV